MFSHKNIWLPDGDNHFPAMMDKAGERQFLGRMTGVYQIDKMTRALAHVRQFRTAVDVGAHVGFWSMWLAEAFDRLHAFEPVADHVDCWRMNVKATNATIHGFPLGVASHSVCIASDPENSGKAHVSEGVTHSVMALDDFALQHVDFIKIDVEGYESAVIQGAAKTIESCRPIIVVESNGQHSRYGIPDPVSELRKMGAVILEKMRHDYVMGWK